MSYKTVITPPIASVTLQWGNTYTFPIIHGSDRGGWVYKPDILRSADEIRNGTNRSFGRGLEGHQAAKEYVNLLFRTVAEQAVAGNPVTSWVAAPEQKNYRATSDGHVGWVNKYGHCELVLHGGIYRMAITARWPTTMTVIEGLNAGKHQFVGGIGTNTVKSATGAEAKELVRSFLADPRRAASTLEVPRAFWEGYEPPGEWSSNEKDIESNETYAYAPHGVLVVDDDYAKGFILKNIHHIKELAAAIEAMTGAQITIGTEWSRDDQRTVKSVSVVATAEEQLPHHITFDTSGIHVTCGYIEDDERYDQYQKRQAVDFLKEIQDTPTTTDDDDWFSSYDL